MVLLHKAHSNKIVFARLNLSCLDLFVLEIDWSCHTNEADVIALSVHGDVVSAQEHGVYVADEKVRLFKLTYYTEKQGIGQVYTFLSTSSLIY